jgi:sugar/nucleoside kinase (ribokinase family)
MNKKILGIGNAIVDVLAKVNDEFLIKRNLIKGSMKLINKSEFETLRKNIKIEKVVAGGSVANTMSGIAYLKGSPSFIGKINSDSFGEIYIKSLEDINVKFLYHQKNENLSTGASIILITPDSERTMCTYLGISSNLSDDDINENNIINNQLIFLEGYLWDKGISEKMFKHTILIQKKNLFIIYYIFLIYIIILKILRYSKIGAHSSF